MPVTQFNRFVREVCRTAGPNILALVQFGSTQGLKHPELSDIDLLVIAKHHSQIPQITKAVRRAEALVLKITHSSFSSHLEQSIFASTDYRGIHLIVLSSQDIDRNFHLKSRRLKILTSVFVSQAIFLYNLKKHYRVLLGPDMVKNIPVPKPGMHDRFMAVSASCIALCLIPLSLLRPTQFKVWCFKIVSFLGGFIETYAKIKLENDQLTFSGLQADQFVYNQARQFRYTPHLYKKSPLFLYLQTWGFVIESFGFLLLGPHKRRF